MKGSCKSLVDLSKLVCLAKKISCSPVLRPLSTRSIVPTEEKQVPSKPAKDSFVLENFRLRKIKGSEKTNNSENKPSSEQRQRKLPKYASEIKNRGGSDAEILSSFQELGLKEELIKAVEKMGLSVPSEIQCVGIPAVLNGNSVILSSGSGSGRTLAYLLPLVQMLRRDEALIPMKPMHPRAIVLCSAEESADQVFDMAKFISHCARLDSSMENGGDSSKSPEDVSNAPIGMLIATPTEVVQHIEDGNISCDDIRYVVLDEADTLVDCGFSPEISKILSPLKESAEKSKSRGFQAILVIATVADMLGEQLSSLMERLERENAGKVTAMLLELDQAEVFGLVESREALKKKVLEAVDSLHSPAVVS